MATVNPEQKHPIHCTHAQAMWKVTKTISGSYANEGTPIAVVMECGICGHSVSFVQTDTKVPI